jgi:hypothetical protein
MIVDSIMVKQSVTEHINHLCYSLEITFEISILNEQNLKTIE